MPETSIANASNASTNISFFITFPPYRIGGQSPIHGTLSILNVIRKSDLATLEASSDEGINDLQASPPLNAKPSRTYLEGQHSAMEAPMVLTFEQTDLAEDGYAR
jgi:hypothetical protein